MNNKPYYVLLTGGKNNAGDFLIKSRAKKLLERYRCERELIDLDGYNLLTDENLELVNGAEAVLLTGGPALHKNMYPNIYRLRDDLDDIQVPITSLGIGWHSGKGRWNDTHEYMLSDLTCKLLDRIKSDGLSMSVRDYHTQNVLFDKGFDNVVMTGCPALYCDEFKEFEPIAKIQKIAFSLGVGLKNSPKMYKQMQDVVMALVEKFGLDSIEVVFHHGLEISDTKKGVSKRLSQVQSKFANWLVGKNISFVDISGSAENLIEYYSSVDLHVGYRVHAHIFMSSLSKPSLLLSEDGRGVALEKVLGGLILPSYTAMSENKLIERLHRLAIPIDSFKPVRYIEKDVLNMLDYELSRGIRLNQVSNNISLHRQKMISFIAALP